jgi:transposase
MYQTLTDQQWQQIEPLFPKVEKRGRGKPHTSWRTVVNSILMVFLTQEKWSAIPLSPEFAKKSVAHRWFGIWDKNGFLAKLLEAYRAACQGEIKLIVPPRRVRVSKKIEQPEFSVMTEHEYEEVSV